MDTFGKFGPDGCDLTEESFYHSNFILPFAISAEPTYSLNSELKERVATKAIGGNDKYELFVKFKNTLRYIIMIS